MKIIFVIIVNYKNFQDTLFCLKSLSSLFLPKNYQLKVIVVDNQTSMFFQKKIKKEYPQVILIANKKNMGFSYANNQGIKLALEKKADLILLLNNDTYVEKKMVFKLVKDIESKKEIGIISPKIYFAPGYEYHQNRYKKSDKGKVIWYAGGILDKKNVIAFHRKVDQVDKNKEKKVKETDFATGCCMLIKKEVFEKIGFFDNQYFLYWEDIDFCYRSRLAGFKVCFSPNAVMWHKNAASSGGAGQNTSIYYQERNRLIFAFKFLNLKTKLLLLKNAFLKLFFGSKLQKKAVLDFFLKKLKFFIFLGHFFLGFDK